MEAMIRVVVDDPSGVGSARRRIVGLARLAGFDDHDTGRVATVVTELGTNLVKHAERGGELLARRTDDALPTIEIVAIDHGPGGDRPSEWLVDGFTTAGSAGTGLGAVQRSADGFEIVSSAGAGTATLAKVSAGGRGGGAAPRASERPAATGRTSLGGITVPIDGEEVNGDAWAARRDGPATAIVVADGLGHGPEAARAARAAIESFERSSLDDLVGALRLMDVRLHSTRGAAAAIAWLDPPSSTVRYAGIGNISASITSAAGSQQLVSANGTVGQGGGRVQEMRYDLPRDSIVILHSDGARSHWTLDDYPGLRRRQPTLVSAVLYRDHRRGRDDVTIVAARVP
jgi:anti-sigma regulatory factor (Ser/Thr protein kinase)